VEANEKYKKSSVIKNKERRKEEQIGFKGRNRIKGKLGCPQRLQGEDPEKRLNRTLRGKIITDFKIVPFSKKKDRRRYSPKWAAAA